MIKCTLAQVFPAAATLVEAYRVPAKVPVVITNILICNHDNVITTFSLAFAPLGVPDDPKQYWFKECELLPNETMDLDIGLILNPNDVIRVMVSAANISFNILGTENYGA